MALKLGAENKRNVVIVGVLLCVLAYLAISQLIGSSRTPAPVTPAPRVATLHPAPQAPALANAGPEAKKRPGTGLDPSLHLDKLAASESLEYAGSGRNIFSADSAPVAIPEPQGPARPLTPKGPLQTGPPPPPQPPSIDLRYFGYAASKNGERKAFFLHGDDVFEAAAGEIVNHRYKVVDVEQRSVQVTDLSYNNTQTLQLVAN
jgi:hypothetical protein